MKKMLLTLLGALTVSAVMAVTAFAGIGEWRQNDYGVLVAEDRWQLSGQYMEMDRRR